MKSPLMQLTDIILESAKSGFISKAGKGGGKGAMKRFRLKAGKSTKAKINICDAIKEREIKLFNVEDPLKNPEKTRRQISGILDGLFQEAREKAIKRAFNPQTKLLEFNLKTQPRSKLLNDLWDLMEAITYYSKKLDMVSFMMPFYPGMNMDVGSFGKFSAFGPGTGKLLSNRRHTTYDFVYEKNGFITLLQDYRKGVWINSEEPRGFIESVQKAINAFNSISEVKIHIK